MAKNLQSIYLEILDALDEYIKAYVRAYQTRQAHEISPGGKSAENQLYRLEMCVRQYAKNTVKQMRTGKLK